jgi:hypothetical protein
MGESKRREGMTSEHLRTVRAARPKPQVYTSEGERGGYTVREGLKGWIVDSWSRETGERTGWAAVVAYASAWPRTTVLADPVSDSPGAATEAECLVHEACRAVVSNQRPGDTAIAGVRVLSRGHIVR